MAVAPLPGSLQDGPPMRGAGHSRERWAALEGHNGRLAAAEAAELAHIQTEATDRLPAALEGARRALDLARVFTADRMRERETAAPVTPGARARHHPRRERLPEPGCVHRQTDGGPDQHPTRDACTQAGVLAVEAQRAREAVAEDPTSPSRAHWVAEAESRLRRAQRRLAELDAKGGIRSVQHKTIEPGGHSTRFQTIPRNGEDLRP